MIELQQPAMALNDARFHSSASMLYTSSVPANAPAVRIIESVRQVGNLGKLRNLVFSCHGAPGYLQMADGFDINNVTLFSRLRGLVDKIWLRGCQVALSPGKGVAAASDGSVFCSRMAQEAGCDVVASTEVQVASVGCLPHKKLDSFEGLVLNYGPNGNITWSKRYKSCYHTPDHLWGMIPARWHQNEG